MFKLDLVTMDGYFTCLAGDCDGVWGRRNYAQVLDPDAFRYRANCSLPRRWVDREHGLTAVATGAVCGFRYLQNSICPGYLQNSIISICPDSFSAAPLHLGRTSTIAVTSSISKRLFGRSPQPRCVTSQQV